MGGVEIKSTARDAIRARFDIVGAPTRGAANRGVGWLGAVKVIRI